MAEAGETIQIVRHGRVVAQMGPPRPWPEGVAETPVGELDLDALERDGIIRRGDGSSLLEILDDPELALPPADPSLPSLLELLLEERREAR